MKMSHFSNVGVIEVFLEATPTTFIITVLFSLAQRPGNGMIHEVLMGEKWRREKGSDTILFLVGYAASILSSAFGISR